MRALLIALTAFTLLACTRQDKKAPFPVPEAKMPAVLLDVHYAEAAMQNLYGDTRDSMAEVYYDQICAIHQIRREQLDEAMRRLRMEPDHMLAVYNRMLELMAEREAHALNSGE